MWCSTTSSISSSAPHPPPSPLTGDVGRAEFFFPLPHRTRYRRHDDDVTELFDHYLVEQVPSEYPPVGLVYGTVVAKVYDQPRNRTPC